MKKLSLVLVLFSMLIALIGCEEKDVPFVSDEDEIMNYMAQSEDAVELFGQDGLDTLEYTVPSRPGSYREVVDSIKRVTAVSFSKSTVDAGGLGDLREAVVNVTDEYYVTIAKIKSTGTSYRQEIRTLVRNGHFLKIGDDSRPFIGWKLYSFSGYNHLGLSIPVTVNVSDSSGAVSFDGDQRLYRSSPFDVSFRTIPTIKLEDMPQLSPSSLVSIDAVSDTSATLKVFPTFISAQTADGDYYQKMDSITLYHSTDTLRTLPGTEKLWHTVNFISFDFVNDWPTARAFWAIPYRTKL
ncbi:MAG: hypothetical protein P1R58_01610 [bacterium]|nr:hypothetical protein [bacterium]